MKMCYKDDILKHICVAASAYRGKEYKAYEDGVNYVKKLIQEAPTYDVEKSRGVGYWDYDWLRSVTECSICGYRDSSKPLYCPKCGSKMIRW